MRYLHFDLSESEPGLTTLEAMASTPRERHAEVLAEARQVLDWAWAQFPHGHGPVEEGGEWDHDLQVHVEEGGAWHTVTLTLTAAPHVAQALEAAFPAAFDDAAS